MNDIIGLCLMFLLILNAIFLISNLTKNNKKS